MKDIQKRDPNRRPDDDIQDAEFVELDETEDARQGRSRQPVRRQAPKSRGDWSIIKISLALSPFFILAMCVASLRPAPTDTAEQVASNAVEPQAAAATDLPPAAELIANNDARVCGHPDIVAFIRQKLLPDWDQYNPWHLTEEEFDRAKSLATVELTEVSASSIKSDIHEVACDANLHTGTKDTAVTQISYKIRAAADAAAVPVVLYDFPIFMKNPMDEPAATVKADRPPPPPVVEPTKSPVSPPEPNDTLQSDEQPKAPTDEQLFSPRS